MDVWENEGGAVPDDELTDEERELLEAWRDGTLDLAPEAPAPGADWQEPVDQHMYPEDGSDDAD